MWALCALFFSNGLVIASILPRLPEVKAALVLDDAAFGLLVAAVPLGAVVCAAAGGAAVRRFGALPTVVIGTAAVAVLLVLAGAAVLQAAPVLVIALILAAAGGIDALVDAAQNVRAIDAQSAIGRTIIGAAHASWSLGAAAGGLCGAAAAGLAVRLDAHLLATGALAVVIVGAAAMLLQGSTMRGAGIASDATPAPSSAQGAVGAGASAEGAAAATTAAEDTLSTASAERAAAVDAVGDSAGGSGPGRRAAVRIALACAVVIAVCGALVEDIANNWVPLFLQREAGFHPAAAGIGFAVVLLAQCVGRILGDRLTDAVGATALVRAGGVLVACGALVAIVAPQAALAGFALCGLGSGPLVPAAFAAAGSLPGLRRGTGVAVVGWLMRAGFLIGSPAIGVVSQSAGLTVGMLLPVGAGLLTCLLAGRACAPQPETASAAEPR